MPLLVEIVPARRGHRTVLWRLLQLYLLHDFCEIDGRSVNECGEYDYR